MGDDRMLSGRPLIIIVLAKLLSIVLIALDQTIVAAALPVIVSDFDALQDATWIVGGYLLAIVAFTPMYGQVLTILPTKWVYIAAIAIFELGSLFCAIATSYILLVFGRIVSGIGSAGICVSVLTSIAQTTDIRYRAIVFAAIGTLFNASSIVGPIIGGAFTTQVSWRWCFYINLPLGALSCLVIAFRLPLHDPSAGSSETKTRTTMTALADVDWIGCLLCLAAMVVLVVPLSEGSSNDWNSPVVISLLCVSLLLLTCLVLWVRHKGERGILPLKVVARRSQIGACITIFFTMFSSMVFTYYIPFLYQAVYNHSPIRSGIDMLPFLLSSVITVTSSALFLSRTGHYWYIMTIGPAFCCIAGGFYYTISEHTPPIDSIIYQILCGIGVGSTSQNAFVALQAQSEAETVSICNAIATFMQILGGFVGVTIAGVVFDSQLRHNLNMYAPSVDPGPITKSVAAIISTVSAADRPGVLHAYVASLACVFLMAVPAGGLTIAGAALMRNVNLGAIRPSASRVDNGGEVKTRTAPERMVV